MKNPGAVLRRSENCALCLKKETLNAFPGPGNGFETIRALSRAGDVRCSMTIWIAGHKLPVDRRMKNKIVLWWVWSPFRLVLFEAAPFIPKNFDSEAPRI
jgi:hypothetical protein